MRLRAAGLAGVSLILLAGCKGSPPPPPPPRAATPPPASPGTDAVEPREPTVAERSAAYTREHPWGDYTGTARLSGRMDWPDAPDTLIRRALVLKGVKGTPSFGLYYRLRADEHGEFAFDRIQGGEFKLSDDVSGSGFHWRLRMEIREGEAATVDLTPANSVKVRDDFPQDGN